MIEIHKRCEVGFFFTKSIQLRDINPPLTLCSISPFDEI
jgi:hypothetical protein